RPLRPRRPRAGPRAGGARRPHRLLRACGGDAGGEGAGVGLGGRSPRLRRHGRGSHRARGPVLGARPPPHPPRGPRLGRSRSPRGAGGGRGVRRRTMAVSLHPSPLALRPSSVLFVFLDGVGLGPPGPSNPLSDGSLPAFRRLAGGSDWTAEAPPLDTPTHVFRPIGATLGLE